MSKSKTLPMEGRAGGFHGAAAPSFYGVGLPLHAQTLQNNWEPSRSTSRSSPHLAQRVPQACAAMADDLRLRQARTRHPGRQCRRFGRLGTNAPSHPAHVTAW